MSDWKKNRGLSFAVIALIYLLAAVAGFALYQRLSFPWWIRLLIADAAATVLVFLFSVVLGNASVYDPYWSVQPLVILALFAWGKALTPLRILLLGAVFFWGVRLTANWAYTFASLEHQDWRYTMLREKTGWLYPFVNFTGIHMVPTLIVYGCTLPAAYAFVYDGAWTPISVLFLLLSVGAVVLQGTADVQMHRYRKNRSTPFIRDGLWKYSRHPNYLGEILMWWGGAGAVIAAFPAAWFLALGALANTVLFLAVSIPLADGRQSQKPDFAQYKSETRMLFPIKR